MVKEQKTVFSHDEIMEVIQLQSDMVNAAVATSTAYVDFLIKNDPEAKDDPNFTRPHKRMTLTHAQTFDLLNVLAGPLAKQSEIVRQFMQYNMKMAKTLGKAIDSESSDVIKEAIKKGTDNPGKVN